MMTTFVGLNLKLKTILRWPFDRILVFGIDLLARIRSWFSPALLYRKIGPNDLRVLRLYPPLTIRPDEPVRCSLEHVLLEYKAEYEAWETQADPNLRLYKKTRAWLAHCKHKYGVGGTFWHDASRYIWGEYMTLSYSWGSETRDHRIIVDGQYVPVTESLEAALRSVRTALVSEFLGIRLWVDAICINQEDIAERGGEVRRMRKIYGESIGCFIHLGLASDDTDLGMESITSIARDLREGLDGQAWLIRIAADVSEGRPNVSQPGVAAAMNLLCRRYWSRMWIIQELAMGQDQIVLCGGKRAMLSDVRQVLKMAILNIESVGILAPDWLTNMDILQATTALLWWIGRVRELILEWDDQGTVTYSSLRSPILSLSQYAYTTDPRDKVYGIMGLLPSAVVSKVDQEDQNYELPTEEVYINFSKAIIEATGDLDVIFACNLKQKTLSKLNIPTWVTDWTLRSDRTSGMDDSGEWYFGVEDDHKVAVDPTTLVARGISTGEQFRADGNRKGHAGFSSDHKLLFCQGFCIGQIEGMAAENVRTEAISSTPECVVQPSTSLCPYADTSEAKSALVRTLMLDPAGSKAQGLTFFDLPWFGAEADADALSGQFNFGEGSKDYFDKLREKGWDPVKFMGSFFGFELLRRQLGMFLIGGQPIKDYFPQDIPECPGDVDFTQVMSVVVNTACRRIITTRTGNVGLAPANVEPDDKIYVLLGSTMPVVLRLGEKDGQYEVLGECYVDGYMKGEAIEKLDAREYQLQEITLC